MTMQSTSMGFVEAVKTCFLKAFTFTGRARRAEYWYWYLFSVIVSICLSVLLEVVPEDNWVLMLPIALVNLGWAIFYSIATFAVSVRRLHDIGCNGWWYGAQVIYGCLWALIMVLGVFMALWITPYDGTESMLSPLVPWLVVALIAYIPLLVYSIVLLVWFCKDSTPGPNKYGENPKGVEMVQNCAPSIENKEE